MKIIASAFFIYCISVLSMKVCANQISENKIPGLWQSSFKIVGDTTEYMKAAKIERDAKMKLHLEEMKKNVANLPPAMRAQMEQYQYIQDGVLTEENMLKLLNADPNVTITPTSTLTKECVVSEKIKDEALEDDENDNGNEYKNEYEDEYEDDEDYESSDSDCVSTITQISKNHFKSINVCEGDDPTTLEADVVFESPKHYTGKGYMTRMANGKSFKLAIETEATWLASDCGDVEPDEDCSCWQSLAVNC